MYSLCCFVFTVVKDFTRPGSDDLISMAEVKNGWSAGWDDVSCSHDCYMRDCYRDLVIIHVVNSHLS